jgi:hypothetical protein
LLGIGCELSHLLGVKQCQNCDIHHDKLGLYETMIAQYDKGNSDQRKMFCGNLNNVSVPAQKIDYFFIYCAVRLVMAVFKRKRGFVPGSATFCISVDHRVILHIGANSGTEAFVFILAVISFLHP